MLSSEAKVGDVLQWGPLGRKMCDPHSLDRKVTVLDVKDNLIKVSGEGKYVYAMFYEKVEQ